MPKTKLQETDMLQLAAIRRSVLAAFLVIAASGTSAFALSEKAVAPLKAGGHVVLMRHFQTVPGTGDPAGFKLGDCSTQRNLSDAGRADARRFGEELRKEDIAIDRVLTSPWCRCIDTAKLALPEKQAEEDASLSSFVEVRGADERKRALEKMRATISSWSGPGNLLMVSHQVTIVALAGESLAQGGILVVKPKPGGFDIVAAEAR
jgi:broad specificity phosphatase PhoE